MQVEGDGTDDNSGSESVRVIGYEGMEHPGALSGLDPSSQPYVDAFMS